MMMMMMMDGWDGLAGPAWETRCSSDDAHGRVHGQRWEMYDWYLAWRANTVPARATMHAPISWTRAMFCSVVEPWCVCWLLVVGRASGLKHILRDKIKNSFSKSAGDAARLY